MVGEDLETGDERHLLHRLVAKDRVISVVDPMLHGHKTAARKIDGYKGHVAVDPDSEVITDTVVTPGNAGTRALLISSKIDRVIGNGTEDDDGELKVYGYNVYGTRVAVKLEGAGIASAQDQSPTVVGCSPRTASK